MEAEDRSEQISKAKLLSENAALLQKLEEVEEALRAIRSGEVDALVVTGEGGEEIFILHGADQSYRLIFEAMSKGVAVITKEGLILHCNGRFGSLLKQPLEKLIGSSILTSVEPAAGFAEFLRQGGREVSMLDVFLRCADESLVPVQLSLNALSLDGVQGLCLVATEITELTLTRERLRRSEERFRLLIEDVRDYAIVALDPEGNVQTWNLGAERVNGYKAGEILGRSFSCFFPPEENPAMKLAFAREHGRFEEECQRIRKDGSRYWAHLVITALHNPAGRLIGFSSVVHDRTREKEAAEALRQSEELFHSAVNHIPGGFAIYDAQQRFQFVNRDAANLLGLKQEAFIGHTNEEMFPPEWISQFMPALNRCVEEKKTQTAEVTLTLPGASFIRLLSFVPILNGGGQLRQILGIGYDITELRRAERQLQEALKKEVVLRREIQHRVKNSIQIISSLLFLQSQELTDPTIIEVLRECQTRTRSIALVYGMLSQEPDIGRVNFETYARQLIGALSSAYEVKREAVLFEISGGQVELDLDTAVPCGLILTELVSNALKYAFPGGRSGKIRIDLQPDGERNLVLTIQDNGIGLPRDHVLEEGHSLGLRLVRDLTQQLGGKIEFAGTQGTTVMIRFPARS